MAETNIAQSVAATNDAASYDTNIKFLLADKQVLEREKFFTISVLVHTIEKRR